MMGFPPERIDVLQEIDGVAFDECWASRITATINGNLEVPVISAEHLIENKLAAGRPRDLLDVEDIREAQLEVQRIDTKAKLDISGWNVGFNKIACTKLLRRELGLGLLAGKTMTDAIVANKTVTVEVSTFRTTEFIAELQQIGVKTVTQSTASLP